ncbi:MAG: hypothetical protein KY475_12205, partial [Planctomycetes bacterium]|nr:hypothetical protein [Planctomycetota bacterium]
ALAGKVEWEGTTDTVNPLFAILFLTPFWAVGLGILYYLMYQGRRRARITVKNGELSIHEATLTGARDYVWRLGEIDEIRVNVNRTTSPPRTRLAISPQGGAPAFLLGNRPNDELQWLAAELRRAAGFEKSPLASHPA